MKEGILISLFIWHDQLDELKCIYSLLSIYYLFLYNLSEPQSWGLGMVVALTVAVAVAVAVEMRYVVLGREGYGGFLFFFFIWFVFGNPSPQ